jgi:hypothetical protein
MQSADLRQQTHTKHPWKDTSCLHFNCVSYMHELGLRLPLCPRQCVRSAIPFWESVVRWKDSLCTDVVSLQTIVWCAASRQESDRSEQAARPLTCGTFWRELAVADGNSNAMSTQLAPLCFLRQHSSRECTVVSHCTSAAKADCGTCHTVASLHCALGRPASAIKML